MSTEVPTTNGLDERNRRFEELVHNVITSRSQFFKSIADPRRSVEDECGYPYGPNSSRTDLRGLYQDLYDFEPVAARVVEVYPEECWQVCPTVYEEEDPEITTDFEIAWNELGSQVRGEESWFKEEYGSTVWEYLRRADRLCGIGQFGCILIGLDDGAELSQPADILPSPRSGQPGRPGRPPTGTSRKIIYLRVFPESQVDITRFEQDRSSPRYGQPLEYSVTFNAIHDYASGMDVGGVGGASATGVSTTTALVHWSRIVHVADNLTSSEVFGVPRMRPVLPRLLDLKKLYGGSAEMYWRGAFPGLSFETHPTLGGDVELDREGLRDMMEDYANGLQRYLALMGMSVKSLAPQVSEPNQQIRVQLEAICIKLGIPLRVFMGSERGEMASSQDDEAWNDRLRERQRNYLTPRLIVPFVDRLISLRVLPKPANGYQVFWPDLKSQSGTEKASVAMTNTQSLAQYISSGSDKLIAPVDYLSRVLGFTEDEALTIIKNAEEAHEESIQKDVDEQAQRQEAMEEAGLNEPQPVSPPTGVGGKPQPPQQPQQKKQRPALPLDRPPATVRGRAPKR